MSNFTDFFPAPGGGGGGGIPKFEEFNLAGTFTPTQALIDAGGYIEIFLVAGGGKSGFGEQNSAGGETILTQMYLTSTTGCAVTIGAGATTNYSAGGNSTFAGSSAGGVDVQANGGVGFPNQNNKSGAGWGAVVNGSYNFSAGNGVFGYGAGGGSQNASDGAGIAQAKANSGQGSNTLYNGGSGYCLIKWYE